MERKTGHSGPSRGLVEDRAVQTPADTISMDVDEASEDSFPASDPPAWMGLRLGRPSQATPRPVDGTRTSLAPQARSPSEPEARP